MSNGLTSNKLGMQIAAQEVYLKYEDTTTKGMLDKQTRQKRRLGVVILDDSSVGSLALESEDEEDDDDDEQLSASVSGLSLDDRRLQPSTPSTPVCLEECEDDTKGDYWQKRDTRPRIVGGGDSDEQQAALEFRNLKQLGWFGTKQDEYLTFIEPLPVRPPLYDTLPPGGCSRFPITSSSECPSLDVLPSYQPSVYKLDVVSRKVEWLSPFEPSAGRSWSTVLIELNSTQLNFYTVPTNMESNVMSYNSALGCSQMPLAAIDDELKTRNSVFTRHSDLKFYKYCKGMGLMCDGKDNSISYDDIFPTSGTSSHFSSNKNRFKERKLVRSYSLQHARIGLATDYKKKTNVLRIRAESEQFLVSFSCIDKLIEWNSALCAGRDISLDILERELSKDRTLPRRRRRRFIPEDVAVATPRQRAESDPFVETRIKNKMSKLKSKIKSKCGRRSMSVSDARVSCPSPEEIRDTVPLLSTVSPPQTCSVEETTETSDTSENSNVESTSPSIEGNDVREEDYEEDVQNLSDLHGSDDEDDDDAEYEEGEGDNEGRSEGFGTHVPFDKFRRYTIQSPTTEDVKWNPGPDKKYSRKKYYRTCLRCIKPLTANDSWFNKVLVKPTLISPLKFLYLKNVKYSENLSVNNSSTVSLDSTFNGVSLFAGQKKISNFKDSIFSVPDTALSRYPNHFLKEFTVGSHGLIPKDI